MKIAILVDKFPCRSQTFVMSHVKGLIERGHDVEVFAKIPGIVPGPNSGWDMPEFNSRIHYFNEGVYMPANTVLRLVKVFNLMRESGQKNILTLIRSLNFVKFGRLASSFHLFFKAWALTSNGPYDIVHCHFGPGGKIGAALKEVGAIKGKLITTFHGYDITSYVKSNGSDVYRSLFKYGDLCLPISERWKNELVRMGCKGEKVVVHRMGIDLTHFGFRPRTKKERGKVQILSIARFIEKKGLEYGIRAVANVVQQYPEIEYKIVGDGPLKSNLSDLIQKLNVEKYVELVGWKPHEEIAEMIDNAHIFLAPSVTAIDGDQEGIPVVIMEALARGVPVLSTIHAGIPELVQDGKSGFLVPERHIEKLAERLEWLARHPEVWEKMGREGRTWVEKHYDVNKLNDQLVNVYERLLERTGKDQMVHLDMLTK